MEYIEKILNLYLSFADTINNHFYQFLIFFILVSIIWVSLIGIVTPVLFISALTFGYYGIFVSLLVLMVSSIMNFFMASKTRSVIKKFQFNEPFFSKDPFIVFLIFRLIPGIPYLIKNLSVVFFKLSLKKFFLAVIISDSPQIIIFTYFFKKLVDSSNDFLMYQNYHQVFEQMYIPMLVLIFFTFYVSNKEKI